MRTAIQSLIQLIFWPIAILLGLVIATSIAVYLFFDPNDYKPEISAFLQSQTELPLTIEGDMHFSLFPRLGLKVEKLSLENVGTIEEVDLKIPLRALLARNFAFDYVRIKGANISLIKGKKKKPILQDNQEAVFTNTKTEKKPSFALKNFDIENTKVIFTDEETKQTWIIDQLNLSGNYFSTRPSPIKATFNFSLTPFKKEILLIGKTTIDGIISFHEKTPIIDLKTKVYFDLPNTISERTEIHAQLKGDLSKNLKVESLTLQSGKVEASGSLNIPIATTDPILFSLKINVLNINKLRSLSEKFSPPTAKAKIISSGTTSVTVTAPPGSTIAGRIISGDLSIDKLEYDKYYFTNVNTSVNKTEKALTLSPFIATFYNGKLNASIKQDMTQTYIKGTLSELPVQFLLRALNKPEKLSGLASIDFNLSQTHNNLEGVIKCQVTNGIIQGIDVNYYIGLAQSLIKKQNNRLPDTKQTPFNVLSATLMLHDNIIDNNDLRIVSADFNAKAEGSVYLSNQTLAYKLQANKIHHDGKEHPNAYPLAIRIKGPIQNPKIEPDLDVYLKKITDVELKKQIDKHLIKNIDKLLGKKDATTSENESEENIGSKVEKEIGRGLKKILKLP